MIGGVINAQVLNSHQYLQHNQLLFKGKQHYLLTLYFTHHRVASPNVHFLAHLPRLPGEEPWKEVIIRRFVVSTATAN